MFISGGGSAGGYVIERSLRCNAASSQYLSRTPSVAGNRKTWTLSTWVKRGKLGVTQGIFEGFASSTNITSLSFGAGGTINLQLYTNPTYNTVWQTTKVFRDPSAYYHIVLKFDTTQASMNDMMRLYVNGELQTFNYINHNSAIPQNSDWFVNSTSSQLIGSYVAANYLDGYQSEVYVVDGQALDASSFGQLNTMGQWVAKKYTGTYGTNGFYLDFKDGTSTTTLGHDKSGNNNHWTLTNFTRSAGVNDCWMLDVPAGNGSASAVQPSGNYAVLNPLDKSSNTTLSKANLTAVCSSSGLVKASIAMESGKHEWQVYVDSFGSAVIGIASSLTNVTNYIGQDSTSFGYVGNGNKINGSSSAYGASYTTGDTITCIFDADARTLEFKKNNVSQGVAFTGIPAGTFFPALSDGTAGASTFSCNFGQRFPTYSFSAGAKALCTSNLPSTDVIESGSFTGNASADGRYVWCNGTPETLTINGNAVTWGTHADKLANGFKLRTSSSSYNSSGTNTWTATILSPESKSAFKHQNAKGN